MTRFFIGIKNSENKTKENNYTIHTLRKIMQPQTVSDLDLAFPSDVQRLIPSYINIPQEFKNGNKWTKLIDTWFFKGMNIKEWEPKENIDKSQAIKHLCCVMGSYDLKHEHKIGGVAYLVSLWFNVPD